MKFNVDNTVLKTYCFSGTKSMTDRLWHVAFAGTENYVLHLMMVILSIEKYNPRASFCFHLFLESITDSELKRIENFISSTRDKIEVHVMNDSAFKVISTKTFPPSYWYRIIMSDFLKNRTDRLLYLDGDMMCYGDLTELFTNEIKNEFVAGVVTDRNPKSQRVQLGTDNYFNSGMMLFYTKRWNEKHILDTILKQIEYCQRHMTHKGKVVGWNGKEYNDQNILNKVLNKQVLWLPKKYNYIYKLNRPALFHKQDYNEDYKKQVILHFASDVKPWHSWVRDWPVVKEYNELKENSPWKDVPVSVPTTRKNYHRAAREYRITHQWGKAFQCYLAYYKRKLLARK